MNWFPSDQFGLAYVSITSRPSRVGMRPTLNCSPLPLAVGTFRVTYRCGKSAGVEGPKKPPDWITVASWPTSSSVRSEEHTSELQLPCNLVCRLLLEKKQ